MRDAGLESEVCVCVCVGQLEEAFQYDYGRDPTGAVGVAELWNSR